MKLKEKSRVRDASKPIILYGLHSKTKIKTMLALADMIPINNVQTKIKFILLIYSYSRTPNYCNSEENVDTCKW